MKQNTDACWSGVSTGSGDYELPVGQAGIPGLPIGAGVGVADGSANDAGAAHDESERDQCCRKQFHHLTTKTRNTPLSSIQALPSTTGRTWST